MSYIVSIDKFFCYHFRLFLTPFPFVIEKGIDLDGKKCVIQIIAYNDWNDWQLGMTDMKNIIGDNILCFFIYLLQNKTVNIKADQKFAWQYLVRPYDYACHSNWITIIINTVKHQTCNTNKIDHLLWLFLLLYLHTWNHESMWLSFSIITVLVYVVKCSVNYRYSLR